VERGAPGDRDRTKVGGVGPQRLRNLHHAQFRLKFARNRHRLAPFQADLGGLGARIEVPNASLLAGAEIDGKRAYCTVAPAYFQFGERRSICLFDHANNGWFDAYYVLGTLRSLTYPAHIPYSIGTPPVYGSAGPTVADVARCADESAAPYNPLLGVIPLVVQMMQEKSTRDMCLSAAASAR
jgi:hypothetical protein